MDELKKIDDIYNKIKSKYEFTFDVKEEQKEALWAVLRERLPVCVTNWVWQKPGVYFAPTNEGWGKYNIFIEN